MARPRQIDQIAEALRTLGLEVDKIATLGPGTAGAQAAAVRTDLLFACGGDGTVHEILQGLARNPAHHPPAPSTAHRPALGIIPLGTANALARELNLPLDPIPAAGLQLAWQPRTVPAGRLVIGTRTTWFAVMAGAGPNAVLVESMAASSLHKRTLGRTAYYLRAAGLYLEHTLGRRTFPTFTVEVTRPGGAIERLQAVSAITVRVATLGGLFHGLATGGSLTGPTLRLTVVRPPGAASLPLWFAGGWLGLNRLNPHVESFEVTGFRCIPARVEDAPGIQADGEWLGRHPAAVDLVPDALRILMPPGSSPA